MNKIKTVAGATLLGAGLAMVGAATAQAAPACSYFGSNESAPGSQGICNGGINVDQSIANATTNLKKNLTLTGNLNLGNLGYAATHGVGSAG